MSDYNMKKVTIKPVSNGFRVKVGCTEVVFTSVKMLLKELEDYINDPDKMEKKYTKNPLNKNNGGNAFFTSGLRYGHGTMDDYTAFPHLTVSKT